MSDNQTAVAAVPAVAVIAAPALPVLASAGTPIRPTAPIGFGTVGFGTVGFGTVGFGTVGFGTVGCGTADSGTVASRIEWTRGVAGGSTVGAYARELSDRTADAMVGDLGATTAAKAGRRTVSTHNSTLRGRPRGRPV